MKHLVHARSPHGPFVFLVAILLLLGTGMTLYNYDRASGEVPGVFANVSGFAWSDNIGWISFNCLNPGSDCSTTGNYGVVAPANPPYSTKVTELTNGSLKGYAWSENIGWISFECGADGSPGTCLSDSSADPAAEQVREGFRFPNIAGQGTVARPAELYTTAAGAKAIRGWVRACSVFEAGCGGRLKSKDQTGGWDGWISLEGTSALSTYGIQFKNDGKVLETNATKYAWSSDVLGWIDFHPNCYGTNTPCGDGVRIGHPPLAVSCTVTQERTTTPVEAIWTAQPSGGNGTYAIEWFEKQGGDPNTFDGNYVQILGDSDSRVVTKTYGIDKLGVFNRIVKVTSFETGADGSSNSKTVTTTQPCFNAAANQSGIRVNKLEPDFTLGVNPPLAVSFLAGEVKSNTGLTTISLYPTRVAPPVQQYKAATTLQIFGSDGSLVVGGKLKVGTVGGVLVDADLYLCVADGTGSCSAAPSSNGITSVRPLDASVANPDYETVKLQLRNVNAKSGTGASLRRGAYSFKVKDTSSAYNREQNIVLNVDSLGTAVEEF